jgi:hypothetical protein
LDLDRELVFPDIVETALLPDMVISPKESKTLIAEDQCSKARESKSNTYADLEADSKDKSWKAILFPVEVRCRGFPAQSMWKLFQSLGMQFQYEVQSGGLQRYQNRVGYGTVGTQCFGRQGPKSSSLATTATHQPENVMV